MNFRSSLSQKWVSTGRVSDKALGSGFNALVSRLSLDSPAIHFRSSLLRK
jgi:hypothetical protein